MGVECRTPAHSDRFSTSAALSTHIEHSGKQTRVRGIGTVLIHTQTTGLPMPRHPTRGLREQIGREVRPGPRGFRSTALVQDISRYDHAWRHRKTQRGQAGKCGRLAAGDVVIRRRGAVVAAVPVPCVVVVMAGTSSESMHSTIVEYVGAVPSVGLRICAASRRNLSCRRLFEDVSDRVPHGMGVRAVGRCAGGGWLRFG